MGTNIFAKGTPVLKWELPFLKMGTPVLKWELPFLKMGTTIWEMGTTIWEMGNVNFFAHKMGNGYIFFGLNSVLNMREFNNINIHPGPP